MGCWGLGLLGELPQYVNFYLILFLFSILCHHPSTMPGLSTQRPFVSPSLEHKLLIFCWGKGAEVIWLSWVREGFCSSNCFFWSLDWMISIDLVSCWLMFSFVFSTLLLLVYLVNILFQIILFCFRISILFYFFSSFPISAEISYLFIYYEYILFYWT